MLPRKWPLPLHTQRRLGKGGTVISRQLDNNLAAVLTGIDSEGGSHD